MFRWHSLILGFQGWGPLIKVEEVEGTQLFLPPWAN